MRIVCQQTILMKYNALYAIFENKKQQNLKLSSAAKCRWRFIGLVYLWQCTVGDGHGNLLWSIVKGEAWTDLRPAGMSGKLEVKKHLHQPFLDKLTSLALLTLKAPITTAADDQFCDIFPNFQINQYDISWELSAFIYGKAANFEIVVCFKM